MDANDGFLENGELPEVAIEEWDECTKGMDALRAGREDWMESSEVAESPREWKYCRSPRSSAVVVGVVTVGDS